MFSGRSHATKRTLYRQLVDRLEALGVPPTDVTIVIIESPRENWGVQGGLPASEIDLGFDVEI
jgi:phenylpyruvate tautomerase PptA (4-oxalocrotonate tautomerase family)